MSLSNKKLVKLIPKSHLQILQINLSLIQRLLTLNVIYVLFTNVKNLYENPTSDEDLPKG